MEDSTDAIDNVIKLLLVGDSGTWFFVFVSMVAQHFPRTFYCAGVGKSSLLLRFIDDAFENISPTIGRRSRPPLWCSLTLLRTGVDFKLKFLTLRGRRIKLTGQFKRDATLASLTNVARQCGTPLARSAFAR